MAFALEKKRLKRLASGCVEDVVGLQSAGYMKEVVGKKSDGGYVTKQLRKQTYFTQGRGACSKQTRCPTSSVQNKS